jgi:hypothetical protein
MFQSTGPVLAGRVRMNRPFFIPSLVVVGVFVQLHSRYLVQHNLYPTLNNMHFGLEPTSFSIPSLPVFVP